MGCTIDLRDSRLEFIVHDLIMNGPRLDFCTARLEFSIHDLITILFPGMSYCLCDHVTFTDQAVVFDRVFMCLHGRATLIGPLFETRALIG